MATTARPQVKSRAARGDPAAGSEADQVLVGTNKTRRRYNMRLRELKGLRRNIRSPATSWCAFATIRPRGF